ncbi:MAG: glycosyltransferase family 2 protein [Hyphomonadaceae bacterium]
MLIPAYNAAKHLPRLLTSAKAQTEPFDEIWVYDDCSSDDTAEVARAFGAQVVRGEKNVGCSVGKNVLATRADAEWLHFHDADDELLPNFVSLARKWIDDGQYDVVLFDYEYRDIETNELLLLRQFDHSQLRKDARSYAIREQINPFCGLYRKSAFLGAGGYDEDPAILYNEDVAFHIRLAFAGLSFAAQPGASVINYRREGSMSVANALRCLQAHVEVMRRTLARPGGDAYKSEIAERLWSVGAVLASYGDWRTADAAIDIAHGLGKPPPAAGGKVFRGLANLHPKAALRLRESMVRITKPHLRTH